MPEEVPLLERRDQGLAEEGQDGDAGRDGERRRQIRRARPQDDPREQRFVPVFQPPAERRLPPLERRVAEQYQAERGRDCQRGHERHGYGEHVREDKRVEEGAREPFEKEHGHHGDDDDQRRVDDRAPHLEGRLEDDTCDRSRGSLQTVLPQAPHDVLNVDDRVVDHDAERDHEPGQHHDVDRVASHVEDEPGSDQRKRNGGHADERRPPLEEERAEDEDDEEGADDERPRQVVDRLVDEVRGPEDLRVDDDVGQPGLHFRERLLDAIRDVERVSPRIFLHDEQQTRPVVDHRVACERHVPLGHVGDLAKADALAVGPLDRHGGQVGRGDDGEDVLDRDALIRGVDESARADDGSGREPEETGVERVGRRLHDLFQRHVVGLHPPRIGQHVQLLQVLAPEGDVRDAGDAQETRPDLPVGDRRELREGERLRRDADLHHPARRRRRRHDEGWCRPRG